MDNSNKKNLGRFSKKAKDKPKSNGYNKADFLAKTPRMDAWRETKAISSIKLEDG